MLEHLLNENELRPKFKNYQLTNRDIDFIKELILGIDIEVKRYSIYTIITSLVSLLGGVIKDEIEIKAFFMK